MRDVAVEHDPPEPLPAPAQSLMPGRKLAEPDQQFIRDIAKCIRAGTRPLTAALWLGASRRQWKTWKHRRGEPYDQLRAAVRAATAHIEMRLQADLAKRSPAQALRGLRPVRDDDEPEPPRAYHQHGLHALKKALPALLDRVNDAAIPDDDLSPVEQAARALRSEMLSDLGGAPHVSAAQRVLIDNIVGSWIIAQSLDRFVFDLAHAEGLASRKHRRAWPVIEQRMRVASVLASQLTGPPPPARSYCAANGR